MLQLDQPQPFPEGSKVVHIGLPKTGTTALQAAVFEQRDELAVHGVSFPGLRRHDFSAAKYAAGISEPWTKGGAAGRWRTISKRFRESTSRATFLSSEGLSLAPPDRIRAIVDDLGGSPQVVITARALAPWLASSWQQAVRRQDARPFDEWLHDVLDNERAGPDDVLLPRHRLPTYVALWADAVGAHNITLVAGDPADYDVTLRQFEGLLGLPDGLLRQHAYSNASLPYPELEMLRQFNLAYTNAGGDHETWMKTANVRSKTRLNNLDGLSKRSIRVPRWAASRANELMTGWLVLLDATDITLVGNPAHLLVDPERYDEHPEVPIKVATGSAGAIAEILYSSVLKLRAREATDHQQGTRAPQDLASTSTRELLAELRNRTRRRRAPDRQP